MKIVVGLGNPGREYQDTRHNIGYLVLAEVASRWGMGAKPRARFHSETLDVVVVNERASLLCPATWMNRSGLAVGEAVQFYKMPPSDVLVVCDDLNLPFGQLRFREGGSSGGQKGLSDIVRVLGTQDVPRLRVGIDRPPERMDAADYVLAPFAAVERAELPTVIRRATDAVEMWLTAGSTAVMNHFN